MTASHRFPLARRALAWTALASSLIAVSACGSSQPTRFYTLATADDAQPVRSGAVDHVTVGQVNLPRMVDKPQVVRRIAADQITLEEFDRWAAPLEDNLHRVFTVDLDRALPPGTLVRSNGTPYDAKIGIVDLDIDRFDADPAGNVTFDISWSVTRDDPQRTLIRRSEQITETAQNGSTGAAVDAMSRAVNDLAQRVASELPHS